jgi:peptidoglycan hydrolase-like protein with peptidoglycan-binding domain
MQEALMARGYDLGRWGADGIFGKQTLKAVKAFQEDYSLKTDGICGPLTFGKLYGEG